MSTDDTPQPDPIADGDAPLPTDDDLQPAGHDDADPTTGAPSDPEDAGDIDDAADQEGEAGTSAELSDDESDVTESDVTESDVTESDSDLDEAGVVHDQSDEALDESAEAAAGPPRAAVILSLIAVVAVIAGLVTAFVGSRTAATYSIDGQAVSRAEAAEVLEGLQPGVGDVVLDAENAAPDALGQARELLNFEIVYALLNKAADDQGVEVTDADILDSVRERYAQDASDDEVFSIAAAATGATEERLRREAEANLIYEGLVASADLAEPSDADIEAAYESGDFAELASQGLNIISVQTQEEADEAIDQLDAGEDFSAVAASIDPAYQGPQRPYDPGFLPPVLSEAVEAVDVGEHTDAIELPEDVGQGFVILQVEPAPPLEEVSDTIASALASQAEGEFLQELLSQTEESTEITVDPVFGEWINGQGLVPPEAADLGAPAPLGGDEPVQDQPAEDQ